MKQMTPEQFAQYDKADIHTKDNLVRKWFDIPETKYYTVSIYPKVGQVRILKESSRLVKTPKISKSNQ